jgi:DNA-binding MurR/RpiR family transcriptional regulator
MTNREARQQVAEYIHTHPQMTYRQISEKLDCGLSTIGRIAREFNISRQKNKPITEADLSKLEVN